MADRQKVQKPAFQQTEFMIKKFDTKQVPSYFDLAMRRWVQRM